jgi:hypothetical protein
VEVFSSVFGRIIRAQALSRYSGPVDKLQKLLSNLAPFLSDQTCVDFFNQIRTDNLCTPANPRWLDQLAEVSNIYCAEISPNQQLPTGATEGSAYPSKKPSRLRARRAALSLISYAYDIVRGLEPYRLLLSRRVLLPLLQVAFGVEHDPPLEMALHGLVLQIAKDNLPKRPPGDSSNEVYESLYGIVRRAAQSTLAPRSISSSPSKLMTEPSKDRTAIAAVSALIGIFHLCLVASTRYASLTCNAIYQDVLSFVSPASVDGGGGDDLSDSGAGATDTGYLEAATLPRPARMMALAWLVRFRADHEHRVRIVRDVDIEGMASMLHRVRYLAHIGSDNGTPTDMDDLESRDAHRGKSHSRPHGERESQSNHSPIYLFTLLPLADLGEPLWSVPEIPPFESPEVVAGDGPDCLLSFDHNLMNDYVELPDVAEDTDAYQSAPDTGAIVLPSSLYLRVVYHILRYERDYEFFSYMICHLPAQLSNKHFSCGPRAARRILALRRLLCEGLSGGSWPDHVGVELPTRRKRAELQGVAYQALITLIAYRGLFNKSQQDEMVHTFLAGLSNSPGVAKPCIHALAIACHELRPSVTKFLTGMLESLTRIISFSDMSVHILELISSVGSTPALYANFTEENYRAVFGIALQYITNHNQERDQNNTRPGSAAAVGGGASKASEIHYAFAQYVYHLAYVIISNWYLALRVSERKKYVGFLTRKLVKANEMHNEIDEPTEVCLDMIARYAYSNVDPRFRRPSPSTTSSASRSGSRRSWIMGNAIISVHRNAQERHTTIVVRRPSGVTQLLVELSNYPMKWSSTWKDSEVVDKILEHRDRLSVGNFGGFFSESRDIPGPPKHLIGLAEEEAAEGDNDKVVATRVAMASGVVDTNRLQRSVSGSGPGSVESGIGEAVAEPQFFMLQLNSTPLINRPLPIPDEDKFLRNISVLDSMPVIDFHKIGVVYVGHGQTTEQEILANTHGSPAYAEFLAGLGRLVRVKGCDDVYLGGLDTENDTDGEWTYAWTSDMVQLVFHVATLMPTRLESDPRCTLKKRHIGNDFVRIIFNESGLPYDHDTIASHFNFVNIVIEPHTPRGGAWIARAGMTNNTAFFNVSMQRRKGMPEIGPLGDYKTLSAGSLSMVVRQLSLHANIFANVFLECIGVDGRGLAGAEGGEKQKLEFVSNWRHRLHLIKRLKRQVSQASAPPATPSGGASAASAAGSGSVTEESRVTSPSSPVLQPTEPAQADEPQRIDVEKASDALDFTTWT